MTVILMVCMTLYSPLPAHVKTGIRIFFVIMFFIVWKILQRKKLTEYGDLSFALFVLNLAFLIATPFTAEFWNLKENTPVNFALIKLSDSVIICTVIIVSFVAAGFSLKSIYISRGKLIPGLITGLLLFILFGYLAINNPQQKPEPGFIRDNYIWVLVFVFANALMEELFFRGIFLNRLDSFFKPFLSVLITSICFAVPHLTVNYQSNVLMFSGIVFILGMICGFAMYYTRSLIAPVLIHAGADLMIIIPVFAAYHVG